MKRMAILTTLLILVLLAHSALAMSSANYRLDWFTPLTGTGGAGSSTHYAINFTVGQVASSSSSSANYRAGLGYWFGIAQQFNTYLPIVLR
jgi:hypothetical protein